MKLKEYFKIQQEYKIDENNKFFIYEKIISQKNKNYETSKYLILSVNHLLMDLWW